MGRMSVVKYACKCKLGRGMEFTHLSAWESGVCVMIHDYDSEPELVNVSRELKPCITRLFGPLECGTFVWKPGYNCRTND